MKGIQSRSFVGLVALALCSNSAVAEEQGLMAGLKSMVTEGTAAVDFRYRFEGVDQDGIEEEAEASTLRSRLTLTSAAYKGFSAKLEMDDLRTVGPDDYNSTTNGKGEFPVVADPEGTDLNQAWIKYSAESGNGTLGRQRINHDNQRFIGGVAWRQNEQTYDGLRAMFEPVGSLKVDLSYIYAVNRIFGPDDGAQPAKWKGDNIFARVEFSPLEGHKVSGFGYIIDVDPQEGYVSGRAEDNSTDTYGLKYSGKIGMLKLDAAYAKQQDGGDSTLSYDADYYLVEGALKLKPVGLKAGYEVLGSDNGVGFKTPLATLHKFQGWADKFLVTPGDGIKDAYAGVTGKAGPVKLGAFYHDFSSDTGGTDFGTEINLVATWPVNKFVTLQAKYANFETDDEARYTDTEKFWLTAQLKL